MKMALEMMVEEALKQDEIFAEFGVESEELEAATQYYMTNDSALKEKLEIKMKQVQA